MPLLIRRISRAKWPTTFSSISDDVPADAITGCLRTQENTLSLWEISQATEIEKAILALISGPDQEKLSGLHIVYIDASNPLLHQLNVVNSNGNTSIEALKQDHRDIADLTYSKIGTVKELIIEALINSNYKNYTKGEVKKIIKDSIAAGVIQIGDLPPKLIENEKLK